MKPKAQFCLEHLDVSSPHNVTNAVVPYIFKGFISDPLVSMCLTEASRNILSVF